jgi:putative ATP-dependent endonuclease of the OLD family
MLDKREIENYYHRDAIQRLIGNNSVIPDDFIIDDYSDIPEEIKQKILPLNVDLKIKNNCKIFEEMTVEEWQNVGKRRESEKTDLAEIIDSLIVR